ncbi:macrolide family glycosyltransferase [Streptomyces alkaliterrae]|uniref:Glycosyl transferase n=1 Tax=Streptomyces alkaliterrae TaxID=2213162 RepID=A0A5P0YXL3_9ACTN|nr:macrolide family glycosyltransferase [Streptomyces alkaliterrae]MBB1254842.1 glycosyl transferase [Streptomyces alkaliterrae]MBB1258724.1 glycosyl transferase [Streptomyces alkaliterrae]MQS03229.1 glycosyl transferase [Streptomyces alkaliterrae]
MSTPSPTPTGAHIAMFSIAAPGHVNPSLDVIRELVDRGHRVSYAIPAEFADKVAEAGAEPRIYESAITTKVDPSFWGTELIDALEIFLEDSVRALPQLAEAFAGDEPDLVLYDIAAYPARVLAHTWGVPAVQLSPSMVAWEGYEAEVGEPATRDMRQTERGIAYYRRFRDWLTEHGLPDPDPDRFAGRPARCVALISEVMQPNADRVNRDVYTFTGPCLSGRAEQEEWRRPTDARNVMLVSLGSAFTKAPDFYRSCVAAFGGLPGWHVVLQIGRHVTEEELGPIPANFEVHSWVPQLAILREADLFVTHAGMGGSQEGLVCRVPMIAVPQAVDQYGNAEMLESLGVARRLETEAATPQALREAFEQLTGDQEMPARWAAVAERTRAEGGTTSAADLIEAELPVRP